MSKRKYFQLATSGNVAELTIYGDITSFPWMESDVSSYNLSRQLAELQDVTQINVYVNSYGGEVGEGLAIYNALKRHSAKVVTYCDGMACSIASVIFMAGDERIMCNPSFLMIHDAWSRCVGNADELRKAADDMDVITSASVKAYMAHCNLSEDELRAKMKAETWITHEDALEWGFATSVLEDTAPEAAAQSAKSRLFAMLRKAMQADETPDDEPDAPEEHDSPDDKDEKPDEKCDENNDKDKDEIADPPAQKLSGFFNALIGQ